MVVSLKMDSVYLKTQKILLRQYREGDFALLMDLNSDPDVMKYLTHGKPSSREDVEAGIERTLFYQKKFGGNLGVFNAELIANGEFMGWFHLRPGKLDPDNTRVLELGYRLKKKFWGLGYATDVSTALIKKAFEELDAESVFAQTMNTNLSSRRVMEKVGMCFESDFFDPSCPDDPCVRYRILRTEWKKKL